MSSKTFHRIFLTRERLWLALCTAAFIFSVTLNCIIISYLNNLNTRSELNSLLLYNVSGSTKSLKSSVHEFVSQQNKIKVNCKPATEEKVKFNLELSTSQFHCSADNARDYTSLHKVHLGFQYKTFPNSEDIIRRVEKCRNIRQLSLSLRPKPVSQLYSGLIHRVPNIVHYVRFGSRRQFEFRHYLSYLSVHKFIQPDYVFLHGDVEPSGYWWNKTVRDVANIFHIHRQMPLTINGRQLSHAQHSTDVVRLEALIDYGGIYLDDDVMVVRSFEQLRRHSFVIGREMKNSLNNGILLATPGAPFARLWLESYRSHGSETWTTQTGHRIAELFPHLLHVEATSLTRPTVNELGLMYSSMKYNWTDNYAVHFMWEERPDVRIPRSPVELLQYDCTMAEVMRFVYGGRVKLASTKNVLSCLKDITEYTE